MQQWVALFYSVVLGPQRRVRSVDLLEVAHAAGFRPTGTALSTGNLLGEAADGRHLVEQRLELAAEAVLGKRIAVFCRSGAAFRRLVNEPPFSGRTLRRIDPTQVAVRIMRVAPSPEVIERIASHCERGDEFCARGDALWLLTRRPLSEARLARAVNAAWAGEGTSRSLSALVKIAAALEGTDDAERPRRTTLKKREG
jgi:uncharacterized protein (DUF1697 family)